MPALWKAQARRTCRALVRAWATTGRANGYLYELMEAYGHFLGNGECLQTRLPNGCIAHCDLRDHVQRNLWLAGVYEPIEAFLFTQLLNPGMVVIDGGANVGQYTVLAATIVGASGSVHSFEPVDANLAHLRKHVQLNHLPNVTLNQAALWKEGSVLALQLPEGSSGNAGAYRARAAAATGARRAVAVALDAYCEDHNLQRVDAIKLDVEGSEPFVLLGAEKMIRTHRPNILIEVNRAALSAVGSSPGDLWDIVSQLGYRAWNIGADALSSRHVSSFDSFEQSNFILHADPLPSQVQFGWTEKSCLAWARSRW
jgi:FkbM family methyltransferase